MATLKPAVTCEYSCISITSFGRFAVLWLDEAPVTLFGTVKMVPVGTGKPILLPLKCGMAFSDSAAKFKHARIVRSLFLWNRVGLYCQSPVYLKSLTGSPARSIWLTLFYGSEKRLGSFFTLAGALPTFFARYNRLPWKM